MRRLSTSTSVFLVLSLLSVTAPTGNAFVPAAGVQVYKKYNSIVTHKKWELHDSSSSSSSITTTTTSSGSNSTITEKNEEQQQQQDDDEEQEKLGHRERKRLQQKLDYERRRDRWMSRYGSLEALTRTFGPSKRWGGDLSPSQTRALYHTLLPRSLLGLHELGVMDPEELAPLAYEARIAAKEYARSRCVWTGRLLTAVFDQYRSLRDRGRLATSKNKSMSWDEIWEKYEGQIVEEECTGVLQLEDGSYSGSCRLLEEDQETLTMRIYLRILERSCATNQAFDSLFLKKKKGKDNSNDANAELDAIAAQLEEDVRSILLTSKESEIVEKTAEKIEKEQLKEQEKEEKRRRKTQEKEVKEQSKSEKKQLKLQRKNEKEREKKEEAKKKGAKVGVDESLVNTDAYGDESIDAATFVPKYSKRWEALRIMAGSRRKFQKLFHKK